MPGLGNENNDVAGPGRMNLSSKLALIILLSSEHKRRIVEIRAARTAIILDQFEQEQVERLPPILVIDQGRLNSAYEERLSYWRYKHHRASVPEMVRLGLEHLKHLKHRKNLVRAD